VKLTLWDWARGPAGRMSTFHSSSDSREMHIADIGAQVLSVRSPADEEHLRSYGAIDAFGLAATTCQRPRDATHLWMPGGLTELLSMQIRDSLPDEVIFNRRMLGITRQSQHYVAEAELDTPPHWLARGRFSTGRYQPEHGQHVVKQVFDAVVVATSANDVLRLHGMPGALGSSIVAALEQVSYDSRLSVTLMLSPSLRSAVEKLFANGQSELDLECGTGFCTQSVLGLLAWQDRKARWYDDCTVVVAHSTRAFARENLNGARQGRQTPEERGRAIVIRALASQLKVSEQHLEASVLDEKVVHWHQGQVQRFMTGADKCLVIPSYQTKAPGPLLALCGDYFTEATFAGCSRSAYATAEALMSWLQSRLAR